MENPLGFRTSDLAEDAFYLAFESGDIEMMMSVWSSDKEVSCIHPGGAPLESLENIRDSWMQIFSHEKNVTFELKHKKVMIEKNIAIHRIIEVISLNGKVSSEIVATNIYCKTNSGWNMILHHASPEVHSSFEFADLNDIDETHTMH